jgi:dienelactone hydrolase
VTRFARAWLVAAWLVTACVRHGSPERESAASSVGPSVDSATPKGQTPAVTSASPLEAKARALVDKLSKRAFSDVVASFDDEMRAALGVAELGQTWDGVVAQAGKLESCGSATSHTQDQWQVIVIDCRFERASLGIQFTFDSAARVSGMFFRPPSAPSAGSAAKSEAPPYASPGFLVERELSIGADPWRLPATLTLPRGKTGVPAVVLVHGSGPHDRDETIGPNQPFRDLALGLATRGVAVLRYEKRSRVYGEQMARLTSMTVNDEVVDDALAAVQALGAVSEVAPNRIFVLGHSLGGTLAPRIAQRNPRIAGLVLLAGATRPMGPMMVEQMRTIAALDGAISPQEQEQIQKVESEWKRIVEIGKGAAHTPDEMLLGAPPSYWIDLLKYDAAATARALSIPILVMQGQRDYQVTSADLDGWKRALAGRPQATFKLYPALNHLFMPGTGKSTPAEYEQPGHVDESVVRDVAEWIGANGAK